MDDFKLNYEINPDPKDLQFLDDKIFENSFLKIGKYSYQNLAFFFREKTLKIVAGLYGHTGLGWLYIDVLWVEQKLRSKGVGRQLLEAAESEALNRGCHDVYLYTYSFQKPIFYEKLGYQIFGQLDNFPNEHTKYFMKKTLTKRSEEDNKVPAH
jgi:GNAT superfamily N-acetyltransferase